MTGDSGQRGVVFDFDGVLVGTDELHYRAWLRVAEQEGLPFDRQIAAPLRGLGRMESLDIVLDAAGRSYDHRQKLALAERKNTAYLELVCDLTPADVCAGVMALLTGLTGRGVRIAVGSSSRSVRPAMKRVGLEGMFDVVVDGNDVGHTKPHPEVFLLAASRLDLSPAQCVVVEDAPAGVEAARRAGMPVLGVGTRQTLGPIEHQVPDLSGLTSV